MNFNLLLPPDMVTYLTMLYSAWKMNTLAETDWHYLPGIFAFKINAATEKRLSGKFHLTEEKICITHANVLDSHATFIFFLGINLAVITY